MESIELLDLFEDYTRGFTAQVQMMLLSQNHQPSAAKY